MSAFNADELARLNVTNAVDLSKVDPSVYVSEATGAVTTFVRGIGNPIGNIGSESSVAYYIDGVYYARLPASFFQFNNIDRVEVLAGPQGTLFGRNASAGLVQIITKNPSFQPAMNVDVGYGNYDTSKVQVYASGGLTDKLAADIAVVYNGRCH